jgi:hypothetical protein
MQRVYKSLRERIIVEVHPFSEAQNPFPFNYSAIPEAVKIFISEIKNNIFNRRSLSFTLFAAV